MHKGGVDVEGKWQSPNDSHVAGQHHEISGGVFELVGTTPLLERPRVIQQLLEVHAQDVTLC